MRMQLDAELALLRDSTAGFIEKTCPLRQVRELMEDGDGVAPEYLARTAGLGWFGLLVPDDAHDSAVGMDSAAVVGIERGAALQPGPFALTNVFTMALAEAATDGQRDDVLDAVRSGRSVGIWVPTLGSNASCVRAEPDPAGFRLNGGCGPVQDAGIAEHLLLAADADGEVSQFLVPTETPGVSVSGLDRIDLTRRFGSIGLRDVVVPVTSLVGMEGGAAPAIGRQEVTALALSLAETVGAMARLFEMTLEHARTRIAFGRPIGSFQAIKHLLADLSLSVEASQAAVTALARSAGSWSQDAVESASLAKSFVGDASVDVAQGCLQVHGGIGYTWEHDLHLFYRRLAADRALLGDPAWHRERVCALHQL